MGPTRPLPSAEALEPRVTLTWHSAAHPPSSTAEPVGGAGPGNVWTAGRAAEPSGLQGPGVIGGAGANSLVKNAYSRYAQVFFKFPKRIPVELLTFTASEILCTWLLNQC